MAKYIVVREFKGNGKKYQPGDTYEMLGGEFEHRERALIPRYIRLESDGEPEMTGREKLAKERKKRNSADVFETARTSKYISILGGAGFDTPEKIALASDDDLLAVKGIGVKALEAIRAT